MFTILIILAFSDHEVEFLLRIQWSLGEHCIRAAPLALVVYLLLCKARGGHDHGFLSLEREAKRGDQTNQTRQTHTHSQGRAKKKVPVMRMTACLTQ